MAGHNVPYYLDPNSANQVPGSIPPVNLNWGSDYNFAAPVDSNYLSFGSVPRTTPTWMSQENGSIMGYQPRQSNSTDYLKQDNTGGPAQPDFGWNIPTVGLGLYGLSSLTNLWSAMQANKIAKEQLSLSKTFGNANLNNSIKQYNTQLGDLAASRTSSMGWSPKQVSSYVDQNKVSR